MKDVDIAIIGAGVISMSIAYYLSKKGYKDLPIWLKK